MNFLDVTARQHASRNRRHIGIEVARPIWNVGDENYRLGQIPPSGFIGEDLLDHDAKLIEIGGRKSADRHVGQPIVPVDRTQGRIRDRPQVGRLHHQRRHRVLGSRAEVVLEIVARIAKE
jgi:hypothetical protein